MRKIISGFLCFAVLFSTGCGPHWGAGLGFPVPEPSPPKLVVSANWVSGDSMWIEARSGKTIEAIVQVEQVKGSRASSMFDQVPIGVRLNLLVPGQLRIVEASGDVSSNRNGWKWERIEPVFLNQEGLLQLEYVVDDIPRWKTWHSKGEDRRIMGRFKLSFRVEESIGDMSALSIKGALVQNGQVVCKVEGRGASLYVTAQR